LGRVLHIECVVLCSVYCIECCSVVEFAKHLRAVRSYPSQIVQMLLKMTRHIPSSCHKGCLALVLQGELQYVIGKHTRVVVCHQQTYKDNDSDSCMIVLCLC